eukprot:TRINITY_DN1905_c0_g1_i2.p1 TRINITY_DN1905_c0_g1~~TRINITY_DN1905_c0_g1_i2.p1  ORF type:complete len:374 (+),score=95.66 TRINITY_DN1905_c0_g1_i2:29-1150(+)
MGKGEGKGNHGGGGGFGGGGGGFVSFSSSSYSGSSRDCGLECCVFGSIGLFLIILAIALVFYGGIMMITVHDNRVFADPWYSILVTGPNMFLWDCSYAHVKYGNTSATTTYFNKKPELSSVSKSFSFDYDMVFDSSKVKYMYYYFYLNPGSVVKLNWNLKDEANVLVMDSYDFYTYTSSDDAGSYHTHNVIEKSSQSGSYTFTDSDSSDSYYFVFEKIHGHNRPNGIVHYSGQLTRWNTDLPNDNIIKKVNGSSHHCGDFMSDKFYYVIEGQMKDPCDDNCWLSKITVDTQYSHRWWVSGPIFSLCIILGLAFCVFGCACFSPDLYSMMFKKCSGCCTSGCQCCRVKKMNYIPINDSSGLAGNESHGTGGAIV